MLRRGCHRGDDRGPRDADQPRPRGAAQEAADRARREPSDRAENDEVQPRCQQRAEHTGRRGGQSYEGKNDKSCLKIKLNILNYIMPRIKFDIDVNMLIS